DIWRLLHPQHTQGRHTPTSRATLPRWSRHDHGLQGILTDMAASQFVSTYQPFKVGEWIEVQGHYGRVLERNLIQTKILTPDNDIVVITKSILLRKTIINRTRSGGLRVQVPVMVEPRINTIKIVN